MYNNTVYVIVQGEKLTGWESVRITKTMESLSGSFSLDMVEQENIDRLVDTQKLLQVYIDDTKIMTSFIDKNNGKVNPNLAQLTITGREMTADLIDCSAINTPGTWNNIKVLRLIEQLLAPVPGSSFLMDIKSEIDFPTAIKKFSINTGDTVFEALQKICNLQNVLPITNADGDIILVDTGEASGSTTDALVLGDNVKEANSNVNFTERFSNYSVKGESSNPGGGWGDTGTKIISAYGEAIDENVTRFRPLQIKAEDNVDSAFAVKRAAWEAQIRAGKSQRIKVMVPEWRQSDGQLWEVNKVAPVIVKPLKVETALLIVSLTYELNESERFTTLSLASPDIFQPEPHPIIKKKVNSGWS